MDKYIGKLLDGRYEIQEVIGVGGMAVVYKAMDHRLNRPVAVKILKDDYSNDAEFRRRFHAESQAVAMMSHPNIVSVYDVSKSEGIDYIVMELIEGITLKQYMDKKGPLSWRETLHFSMQIAKALEHSHSRNIIHRDIKPHNVMILKDGSVKVADFGIARVATAQNTLTKEALGSVHYISPEQARGARVDNRTDIYSLGVVMYEMLTGRPPYDGETPVSVAIQHINGTPLSPSLLNGDIPTGLEQITMHAMCSDINIRYASISDMLKDMEEFRKNPAIRFTFLPTGTALSPANSSRTQVSRQQVSQRHAILEQEYEREDREEKNRRILMFAALALALLALIGIIYLIVRKSPGSDNPQSSTNSSVVTDVRVPQMIGQIWDEKRVKEMYPDFMFIVNENSYVYNEDYPEGVICDQSIPVSEKVAPGTEVFLYVSMGEQTDVMPDLKGRSEDYALAFFKTMDIQPNVLTEKEYSDEVEEGHVTRTDPEPGSTLKDRQIVTIYISMGRETKTFRLPSVVGTPVNNAITALKAQGLRVKTKEEYSETVAKDYVISQSPESNTEVEEGDEITLIVSKGKETVTMINVVGDSEYSARSRLEALHLVVYAVGEYSDTVAEGVVMQQSYAEGLELLPGTKITLTISLGPKPAPPETEPPPPETEPPVSETTAPPETDPPVDPDPEPAPEP